MGATIPFPATREEREKRGDPRLSIAERYPTKTDYLAQIRRAANALVEEGYLLAEDLDFVVDQAAERYELLRGRVREPLSTAD
jgi:hypothetical protein